MKRHVASIYTDEDYQLDEPDQLHEPPDSHEPSSNEPRVTDPPLECDSQPPLPTWMGDLGFDENDLAAWNLAESRLDIKSTPPKLAELGPPKEEIDYSTAKFMPNINLKGHLL